MGGWLAPRPAPALRGLMMVCHFLLIPDAKHLAHFFSTIPKNPKQACNRANRASRLFKGEHAYKFQAV